MRSTTRGRTIVLIVAGLLSSGMAAAAGTGGGTLACPAPHRIVFSAGAYSALEATVGWEGEWRSASTQQGPVARFESALVHRDASTGDDKLAACTYETKNGRLIDMAYYSNSAPGRLGNLVVRLVEPGHWQPEPGGFLECAGSAQQCRMVPLRFETLRVRQIP